jgi:hypothetical protein
MLGGDNLFNLERRLDDLGSKSPDSIAEFCRVLRADIPQMNGPSVHLCEQFHLFFCTWPASLVIILTGEPILPRGGRALLRL